ncbi:MAG: hypothetical protein K5880_06930 [Hydrogenophaga sp.]|uniref:hypothetical protein n=1 Tax=Hydrogenophaga sp. TaxID=1904254 RepID=UPI00262D8331|nr:hypothetical protein [Hydrogenophaga sp.]MCV0438347.1 hypothetical protein [Hydrogenophaga sp.]
MSNDQGSPSDKWSLIPSPSQIATKLGIVAPSSTSASADWGSVAVAGDNNGSILNVNATHLTLAVQQQVARQLPSYLSSVVAKFSEDWSSYGDAPRRSLPPEIDVKLAYNDFPPAHPIITDYLRHIGVLESTYRGIEQRNDDARRMVRRRTAVAYKDALHRLCDLNGVHHTRASDFARRNAVKLVKEVVAALTADFQGAALAASVMQETADLAISLIVADAVIECEVLERPADAAAT